MADYTGGYTGAVDTLSQLQSRGVLDAQRAQAFMQAQRAAQAQAAWGPVLARMMQQPGMAPGAPPAPPGIPPMPGTMAGGPQPPPPGTASMPAAPVAQAGGMAPMPQMGPAPAPRPMPAPGGAPMAPAPIPPFRALPSTPPEPAAAPSGDIPPPPGAGAAPPAPVDAAQQFALPNILKSLKQSGVPPEQWGMMLDNLPEPVKNNAAQQIKMLHEQNQSLISWANAESRRATADASTLRAQVAEDEAKRRREQGDERLRQNQQKIDLLRAKAQAAAGGSQHLKSVEMIYPKGADGRPDETQAPIGTRGVTKTGKIITLDANGNQTTQGALAGGTAKEGKDVAKGSGGQAAVRSSIVKGGVVNSIKRLDEIEKMHPAGATSAFFGQHGDNPLTRSIYGHAAAAQGGKQQDIDAKWASFIDEAIPVFTGGLRGSDAFRRFLIEQAPGPGAKPAIVKEKMRLFRENINGTSKAFFSKFKDDPTMWATGVTPEQVQGAVPHGTPAPAAPSAAAPAAGAWKVEKVQ